MRQLGRTGWTWAAVWTAALLGMSMLRAQEQSFPNRSCITNTCYRSNGQSVQRYECLAEASATCTIFRKSGTCHDICDDEWNPPAACFENFGCLKDNGKVEFIKHCAPGQGTSNCQDEIGPNCKGRCR